MKEFWINDWTKVEAVEESENYFTVTFFELMGNRWVALGPSERWSKEFLKEELGE